MTGARIEVDTVTIPASEYKEFLECRAFVKRYESLTRMVPTPKASPIDRDPELATFIANRLGLQTISQIASECRENFGSQRAPSKSAIHRYWIRQRATSRRSARPSISP